MRFMFSMLRGLFGLLLPQYELKVVSILLDFYIVPIPNFVPMVTLERLAFAYELVEIMSLNRRRFWFPSGSHFRQERAR